MRPKTPGASKRAMSWSTLFRRAATSPRASVTRGCSAEMRLYQADLVQSGRLHSKLYAKLPKAHRYGPRGVRETYFSPCPAMVIIFTWNWFER